MNAAANRQTTPTRRRIRPSEMVAWLVILATVVVVHFRRASGGDAVSAARTLTGLEMKIMARYSVGAARLLPSNAPIGQQLYQQGSQQLMRGPPSAANRLRWAVIAGELAGPPEASRLLEELLGDAALTNTVREDAIALQSFYTEDRPALSEAVRERLLQRHGWYARLALSRGLAPDSPERQAALLPALRTFIGLITAMIVGGALVVAGLVLLVAGIVWWGQGKIRDSFDPPSGEGDGPPYGEVFALVLALFMSGSILITHLWRSFWGILAWYGVVGLVALGGLRWRGTGWREIRRGLGLHAGRGWWREAGAGLAGYLAGLPLMGLAVLLMFLVVKLARVTPPMHPIAEWLSSADTRAMIPLILVAVFAGPFFEEILFRGMFYRHVRHHLGWFLSAVINAFVFAAIHPQGWYALPPLMTLGFTFGCLREWRGSLVASTCAHVFNNAVVLTLAFFLVG